MSKKSKVKILLYPTYLQLIKNSIRSHLFCDLYALVDGQRKNITENGRLSCAFFVSTLLRIFGLVNNLCPTVNGLIKELKMNGWQKVNKPKPGAVIIWQAKKYSDGSIHKHAGFYIGKNRAISNIFKKRYPIIHCWTCVENKNKLRRGIEAIFWHRKLN